jgi:hypothetical protein
MRTLNLYLPLAFCASIMVAMPAIAGNAGTDRMTSCASAWNAMSAEARKATTYRQYSSDCLSGKSASAKPPTSRSATSQDRMKNCAAEWDRLKATGKTAGLTYQKYSARCLKN